MCYRTDLFEQAGLPTDREELAKKWATWDGYLDLGKQYKAKAPPRAPGSTASAASTRS